MRKIIKWLLMLGAVFAVLLVSLPLLVSSQSVERELSSRVKELTGLQLNHARAVSLKFYPYLGVELDEVTLSADFASQQDSDIVTIDRLGMKLEIFALLTGQVRFKDFVLTRAVVRGEHFASDNATGPLSNGAIALAVKSIREKTLSEGNDSLVQSVEDFGIGSFEIIDGEIAFGTDAQSNLSDINGNVYWASALSAFRTNLTGVWRGEVAKVSASFEKPLEILAGRNSPSEIKISSSLIELDFEGTGSFIAGLVANGTFQFKTPDAVLLLAKLDDKLTIPFSVGPLAMSGTIIASGNDVQLNETVLTINEDNASGNLQLNAIGSSKFRLSGTLAFDSLDLTRLADASGLPQSDRQSVLALDLRFSSSVAKLGALDLNNLAATLVSSDENWELEIGDGSLLEGSVTGKLNATNENGKTRQTITGTLIDMPLQPLINIWHKEGIHISGKANANFELQASQMDGWPSFEQLSGNISLKMSDGALEGLDLAKVSADLGREDGFLSSSQISGATTFSEMEADMTVFNGISWVTRGKVDMEQGHASLFGKIDMAGGGLAMNAVLFGQPQTHDQSTQSRFFIGGTLKNALITKAIGDNILEEDTSSGQ